MQDTPGALAPILELIGHTALSTPAISDLPGIGELWNNSGEIVVAVYGPRIPLAFMTSALSLFFTDKLIRLANGLALSILGDGVNAPSLGNAPGSSTGSLRRGDREHIGIGADAERQAHRRRPQPAETLRREHLGQLPGILAPRVTLDPGFGVRDDVGIHHGGLRLVLRTQHADQVPLPRPHRLGPELLGLPILWPEPVTLDELLQLVPHPKRARFREPLCQVQGRPRPLPLPGLSGGEIERDPLAIRMREQCVASASRRLTNLLDAASAADAAVTSTWQQATSDSDRTMIAETEV